MGGIFGQFEIRGLIGKGGMAEVYRAEYAMGPKKGRKVAIKRLLPQLAQDAEYVELFIGEADVTRMLHHPNIIETYETGEIDGQYFMVMEFIDGKDLGEIVRRCKERSILLPVDFSVFLAVSLLEALAYAHDATAPSGKPLNIVHCDVSPSNLFISRVGEIKLGDFGVARVKTSESDGSAKIWGKAYYLSPEMLDGFVDRMADLWAAAATLYELLCNERPFRGAKQEDVLKAIRRGEFKPINQVRPEVSDGLAEVVHRGLAHDRSERYPTARAFIEALQPHYNELIGNPMAIAAVVRGFYGA